MVNHAEPKTVASAAKDSPERKEYKRLWRQKKYATDRKFRHAESDRKAEWLKSKEGQKSNAAATARYRARLKKKPSGVKRRTK